jgi:hypothetical protein
MDLFKINHKYDLPLSLQFIIDYIPHAVCGFGLTGWWGADKV